MDGWTTTYPIAKSAMLLKLTMTSNVCCHLCNVSILTLPVLSSNVCCHLCNVNILTLPVLSANGWMDYYLPNREVCNVVKIDNDRQRLLPFMQCKYTNIASTLKQRLLPFMQCKYTNIASTLS